MAYKKQSVMDDVFEICARLPWWFGVLAAVISYFIFHYYAVTEIINDGNMAEFTVSNIKKSTSYYLQYIVPFFCTLGALASYLKRRSGNGSS
jgi:restriction system protein